jgi:hypothetical protein
LNTIYKRLFEKFYVLEIGFQNSFITTAATFQHGFCPIRTSKNLGNPLMKIEKNISEKNIIFPKGFLLNREKKIYLKLWGPLKILKPEAVLIQA